MKAMRVAAAVVVMLAAAAAAFGQAGYTDLAPGAEVAVRTLSGVGLPPAFGSTSQSYAVLRMAPLAPGRRYELTLRYDEGTDISYGHSWVDGDPSGKDWFSFIGLSTTTGTRELKGKEVKFLFSVDGASSSNVMYLVIRSTGPWNLAVGLTDRLSGVTRNSQDRWGYYYVDDFDVSRASPFLLTRGGRQD